MSEGRTAAGTARRAGSGANRLVRAWRALPHESRLAAFACGALFVTLFMPWYQVTLIASAKSTRLESASATITGWGAFSFVEAAVLVVAAAVLTLLFQRAEGRAFHLPGGDGGVIAAAGLWTCVLIVWRIFDKQGATTNGPSATSSGVEWGIFIALAAAAFLAYSGSRIRAAHRPEPPLPGEDRAPAGSSNAATEVFRPRSARPPGPGSESKAPLWSEHEAPSRRRPVPPRPGPPASEPTTAPRRAPATEPRPAAAPDPAPDQPRRRATAAELFERVVPEDPPTMKLSRIEPSRRGLATPEPEAAPPDEQMTIPFEGREDPTLIMGEDATVPTGEDATVPLGEDPTLPLHERPRRH